MIRHKHQTIPTGFRGFTWAIGLFCLPITLYPVAMLLSANFMENPNLSPLAVRVMTVYFWVYPIILVVISRLLYRLHQHKPKIARWGLGMGIGIFYLSLYYIFTTGFIYDL